MTGFTIKNLKDIEDATENTAEIEARLARFRATFGHGPRQQARPEEGDGVPAPDFWID